MTDIEHLRALIGQIAVELALTRAQRDALADKLRGVPSPSDAAPKETPELAG